MKRNIKIILDGEERPIFQISNMLVGEEAEIADEILNIALGGYVTFANHLKNPEIFYKQLRRKLIGKINNTLKV
jgi:hypothetical protein